MLSRLFEGIVDHVAQLVHLAWRHALGHIELMAGAVVANDARMGMGNDLVTHHLVHRFAGFRGPDVASDRALDCGHGGSDRKRALSFGVANDEVARLDEDPKGLLVAVDSPHDEKEEDGDRYGKGETNGSQCLVAKEQLEADEREEKQDAGEPDPADDR